MTTARHGAFLTTAGCLAMVVLLAGLWLGYWIGTDDCRSIRDEIAERQALIEVMGR